MTATTGCGITRFQAVAHPTDDHYPEIKPGQMTILRISNTPNVWVGPLLRIHGERIPHTVLGIRPDGKTVDLGNRDFTLYRCGELNRPEVSPPNDKP